MRVVEPRWVRPAYLHLVCLVGVLAMAIGAVLALLGAVHIVSPDLQRQGDPLFRALSSVLDVAEVVASEVTAETDEPLPPGVEEALDEARKELDNQARDAGSNELITGLIVFVVGGVIFRLHWRRAESLGSAVPLPREESPGAAPDP